MNNSILITGCNSGIGAATAKLFLEQGWEVIATVLPTNPVNTIAAIKSDSLHIIEMDITIAEHRRRVIDVINNKFGGTLDCLINNAGVRNQIPFEYLPHDLISKTIDVNLTSTCLLTRECIDALIKTQGRVVCISSVAGFIPIPMGSIYTACKYALEGFVQCLAIELKDDNVQICSLQPGAHETPINNVKDLSHLGNSKKLDRAFKMATCLYKYKKPPADNVARKIYKLIQMKNMPIQSQIGTDAKLHYFFRSILPFHLWMKFHKLFFSFGLLSIQP